MAEEGGVKVVEPNRHATMFLYLNDGFDGGETVFPLAKGSDGSPVGTSGIHRPGMPECSKGLAVKPVQGAAALFYSKLGDMRFDPLSMHGGCPPGRGGVKYGGNLFCWNVDSSQGYSMWKGKL